MPSDYDATEFVDTDLLARKAPHATTVTSSAALTQRAPTREEVDSKVAEAQQKLAELKRAQEELERERASLEEVRRRQMEFQKGRQETLQDLTRGLGLLQEAEFNSRRDAEQMARAIHDLGDAMKKVQAIQEEAWTKESFNIELTKALTAVENARMEWNSARLKFPVLSAAPAPAPAAPPEPTVPTLLSGRDFGELCRVGLALTWPLALVATMALGLFAMLWFSRH